jgi:hypothetical protein
MLERNRSLGLGTAEVDQAHNNKRGIRPVFKKKSDSQGTGRPVDKIDMEVEVVSWLEEVELADKMGEIKHRPIFPLAYINPAKLSLAPGEVVDERMAELFARAWEKKEELDRRELESDTRPHGVKPYRNIENIFLPVPRDMEAISNIVGYVTQDHGGRPEASASRSARAVAPDNYLDAMSDAEDFKNHLINKIEQMMYVSGETGEPSAETTGMIEEIVRQQVVEIVSAPFLTLY